MGFLLLLMLCFFAFIAWAPAQGQQAFLAISWGLMLLSFAVTMLYGLGRYLLA